MAEANPAQSGTITVQTAANLLMLTPRRVQELTDKGYIQKQGRDQYLLVQVVQGYIRFLKDEERRTSKGASQSRVADARAALIELQTQERANKLIPTEEAINFVDEIVGILRWGLNGLPARCTRDTALRRKLRTELDGVLQRASERSALRAADLRTSGTLSSSDTEDDA